MEEKTRVEPASSYTIRNIYNLLTRKKRKKEMWKSVERDKGKKKEIGERNADIEKSKIEV